ncbi:uncharacterized protein LOC114533162 [Dendronephthya gigantea]|uniref:uncharacterized protein LOC114533162 n=1 Tax=Dendronephthya gigantea TaxID=151771 RepID=UPI00106D6B57|nr:uncharacterized protein LOC114533162 [Dendronephthya gigantea]
MKSCFLLATICIFVLRSGFSDAGSDFDDCKAEFEAVGCYRDRRIKGRRALGDLIFNHRDQIDWLNFGIFISELVCDCAKKAKEKGFTYFGLQFYGECWGSEKAGLTFAKYGKTERCWNGNYSKCQKSDKGHCVGRDNANFVFKLSAPEPEGSGSGNNALE